MTLLVLNSTQETFNLYWVDFWYILESCWCQLAESYRSNLDPGPPMRKRTLNKKPLDQKCWSKDNYTW